VDQHGLVGEPRLPGLLADAGEHALAQFPGPGHEVQAFGLALLVLAEHGAAHVAASSIVRCNSRRTGAGMPSAPSAPAPTQRRPSLSATPSRGATASHCMGCNCRR